MPNKILIYICMRTIYMFIAYIWLISCINQYISFKAYCKMLSYIITSPQCGELPLTLCRKKGLNTKFPGESGLVRWIRQVFFMV